MPHLFSRKKRMLLLTRSVLLIACLSWTKVSAATQSESMEGNLSQKSTADVANNPLESLATVDLHNHFEPSPDGHPGKVSDLALWRLAVPVDTYGVHQFIRAIVPITTSTTAAGRTTTNVGDVEVYDILPFETGGVTLGFGPLVAAPTSSAADRWQAGAVAVLIALPSWGLASVLMTWQHSLSGDSASQFGRIPAVGELTTVQPFLFYNLSHGFYIRSSGVMTFDTMHHEEYVPLGFGLGKILAGSHGDIANLFFEPEYSVYHSGLGSPQWQIYAGATFKFPVGERDGN